MWYTVLRQELEHYYNNHAFSKTPLTLMAGSVWTATKLTRSRLIQLEHQGVVLFFTPEECRQYFTTPVRDQAAAMEESFMIAEAAYC
jgi:hypothetical protein